MVNKKVVVISTIIALIVIAGIVTFAITKSNNYSESTENNIKTESTNNVGNNATSNTIENKVEENKVNENAISENAVVNNTTENKTSENNTSNNKASENKTDNNSSKKDTSKTQDNESYLRDVAISLAKKEWGEDNSVYYSVEDGSSKDEYIVSIRDSSTTAEIVTYNVNVKTKTVKEN